MKNISKLLYILNKVSTCVVKLMNVDFKNRTHL